MERRSNKSLALTIVLAIIISGLGHLYLGFVNRGIIILILGFAIGIGVSMIVPFPYSLIFTAAYWIWQIYDAYKHYKKISSTIPR